MKLRAAVRTITGKTRHLTGAEKATAPDPLMVELVAKTDGVFLFRLDADGACVADTWHESVEAAKAQARFEYEIEEDDWRPAA